MSEEKTLIHFHIPRTAGSTLDMIMRRHFPRDAFVHLNVTINPRCIDEFIRLPEKKRGEIRYLDGHMPFGLHAYLPHSSTYVTVLRDPVDRVISEYYGVIQTPVDPLYRYNEVTSKNMSLADYVLRRVHSDTSRGISNFQTRCISGVQWGDLLHGSTPAPSNILETAKANLREYFSLVGLSERFDESLILLKRALGWRTKDILYVKQQVGRNRPPKDTIGSEAVKLVEDYNELDMQLYEFAKQMFEERISRQDSSFRRELQIFRLCNICNTVYGRLMNTRLQKGVDFLPALVRGDLQISYIYNKVYGRVMNSKLHTGFVLLRAGIGKVKAVARWR